MIGLLAYVAGTSINNAVNLDRAPNLINATFVPTAEFARNVQNERAAAVVYLFQPSPDNLAAYQAAVAATTAAQPGFLAAMDSPGTKSTETADEAQVGRAGLEQVDHGGRPLVLHVLDELGRRQRGRVDQVGRPVQVDGVVDRGVGHVGEQPHHGDERDRREKVYSEPDGSTARSHGTLTILRGVDTSCSPSHLTTGKAARIAHTRHGQEPKNDISVESALPHRMVRIPGFIAAKVE